MSNTSQALHPCGFSMVALAIGSGIMGILLLSMLSLFDFQNKSIHGVKTILSRDGLKAMLDYYSGDLATIKKSADHSSNTDSAFEWCVKGTTTCNGPLCCKAGISYPFNLVVSAPTPEIISGTASGPGTPAYYSADASHCSPPEKCPIQVHTSFIAECAVGTECDVAKRITVTYSIEKGPLSILDGAGTPLKTVSRSTTHTLWTFLGSGLSDHTVKWTSAFTISSSSLVENSSKKFGLWINGASHWDPLSVYGDSYSWISMGIPDQAANSTGVTFMSTSDGKDLGAAGSNNKGWNMKFWSHGNPDIDRRSEVSLQHWNGANEVEAMTLSYCEAPGDPPVECDKGKIGIHNPNPQYALDVTGSLRTSTCVHANGEDFGDCASDERLKKDVRPFTLGLAALAGIQPKYFRYNGKGGQPASEQDQLGVIAQDLEKTAPELVTTKPGGKWKAVNYGGLLYVAINSAKELYAKWLESSGNQQRQLAALKEKNLKLKRAETAIESKTLELEQRLERMEQKLPSKSGDDF
ncbi:MAG: hypothetical protein A2070_01575 [Bdellovibrionales bacterium GWC1_52_8]|nr:MAG: hypothetical protein A2Z97_01165 [Bdellovibrionales bacterium GWB1_52_6]OFZ05432.1 MAG: hypothetical protein A2X97_11165 [Bdellovibrionales bacterium GWA1_52_35]OFZ41453.1 MAG: hypothetical protein A2070_01575 [Bdellovibrionales bacterium GWC1_52_8]